MLPGPRTPWAFARDVWGLATSQFDSLARFRERYGTVSEIGVPPLRFTFVLGREANESSPPNPTRSPGARRCGG